MGGRRKPRCSGAVWLRPSSMALMARKTSSLTVLIMSSSKVCVSRVSLVRGEGVGLVRVVVGWAYEGSVPEVFG